MEKNFLFCCYLCIFCKMQTQSYRTRHIKNPPNKQKILDFYPISSSTSSFFAPLDVCFLFGVQLKSYTFLGSPLCQSIFVTFILGTGRSCSGPKLASMMGLLINTFLDLPNEDHSPQWCYKSWRIWFQEVLCSFMDTTMWLWGGVIWKQQLSCQQSEERTQI